MKYYLHFKYIYSFYSFGELLSEDIVEESFEAFPGERIKLRDQEDGSFLISEIGRDSWGKFLVLTAPNKDNALLRLGEACELEYDEYYSAMGDDNHNVYVGSVVFDKAP